MGFKTVEKTSLQFISVISEREWRKLVGIYNTIVDIDPLSIVSIDRVRKSLN